ncbi:hypothetical protein FRB96_006935 [Tulasnella sp. 330]|nr:hypothetical protein FRB96_006935 [Tulasnella sp. 330]KAG8876564.1 hypothetical protein FRB97_004117 [Tulasnella sp. 331]KAG8889843.1 hypothetical protein FRB98_002492 [Tulasnella sp. 332]
MDSDSLYYLRNQFYLGNFKYLCDNPLPAQSEPSYLSTLCYSVRSHIALKNYPAALSLLPTSNTSEPVRALRALVNYLQSAPGQKDAALEELRDLCLEVEEDSATGQDEEGAGAGLVKVAAATAFVNEKELEEALTTLGAGCKSRDIECVALIVYIYLSIARADLAKKEYEAAKKWADDSLLIQMIEATIGLAVVCTSHLHIFVPPIDFGLIMQGSSTLQTAQYIYDEQASSPGSSTNPSILTAKGITQLLLGKLAEADNSLSEALTIDAAYSEALAAKVVVAELRGRKADVETASSRLISAHGDHPMLRDLKEKSSAFDAAAAKFTVSSAA